jgi:putative membrane protein
MHHFSWYSSGLCGPGSSFHGPWGFVMNLVFWCLVLAALVWFFRVVTWRDRTSSSGDSIFIFTIFSVSAKVAHG